ncbi:hypothetical protein H4219_005632 [Mycoemilia scoparia]|uniref:Protein kinase domain-containing protein n=1 Tax=Mycoemilia scoparia TaxID=417184 RepID=A0A9W7ZTU3_9FUNG|nr:hypothetical protein H4219_005632 [Mycoemilia scoparia]
MFKPPSTSSNTPNSFQRLSLLHPHNDNQHHNNDANYQNFHHHQQQQQDGLGHHRSFSAATTMHYHQHSHNNNDNTSSFETALSAGTRQIHHHHNMFVKDDTSLPLSSASTMSSSNRKGNINKSLNGELLTPSSSTGFGNMTPELLLNDHKHHHHHQQQQHHLQNFHPQSDIRHHSSSNQLTRAFASSTGSSITLSSIPPVPPQASRVRLLRNSTTKLGQGRYSTVYRAAYASVEDEDELGSGFENASSRSFNHSCAVKVFNSDDEDALELAIIEICALHRIYTFHNATPTLTTTSLPPTSNSDGRGGGGGRGYPTNTGETKTQSIITMIGLINLDTPCCNGGGGGQSGGADDEDGDIRASSTKQASATAAAAAAEYKVLTFDDVSPQLLRKQGTWAMVLEDCTHGDTWSWIQNNKQDIGPDLFFQWGRQLAIALQAMHEAGVSHNDIKPHNLLLSDSWDIRLADMSAAKFDPDCLRWLRNTYDFDPTTFICYTDHVGTIPHSAPEMLSTTSILAPQPDNNDQWEENFDPVVFAASDVFSLGVSLYILFISAREPYQSIRNGVELMLRAKSGAFWTWEQQNYHQPTPPLQRSQTLKARKVTNSSDNNKAGGCGDASCCSAAAAAAVTDSHNNSRNGTDDNASFPPKLTKCKSLNLGRLHRRRTFKIHGNNKTSDSSKTAGAAALPSGGNVIHFLDCTEIPRPVVQLLQSMVDPQIPKRPTLDQVISRLDELDSELFVDENSLPTNNNQ